MEINLKMNPSEAIAAVNSGMFLGLLEVVKASESISTDIVKAAQQPAPAPVVSQQLVQAPIQQSVQQTMPQEQYGQPIQQSALTSVQQLPVQQQMLQEQYTQQPIQQPIQQAPTGVPTTAPSYTMEQLAVAAQALMDAGRVADLRNLLASFNVAALTVLPKEQYGAFATQLRTLGGKI